MIALVPDPMTAEKLLVTGGEAMSDLHLTLAYCPSDDVTQVQVAQIIASLAELAKSVPPIEAEVSGVGRFQCDGDDEDDKDVLYASVDSPKLPPLHYSVSEILYRYQVPRATEHGFTPHITLKYLEPDEQVELRLPDGPMDVKFEYLVLRAGEDEVAIELEGTHRDQATGGPGLYGTNPLFESALLESVGTLELQEQQGVLLESKDSGDKSGSKWRVLLIKAGTSGNRVHYPESVLRQAAPLFEGTKAFADHPSKSESTNRPERSVRDVVGWYSNVAWSSEHRGLTADFHVLESADWLRQSLMSSWKGGNPTLLGFSINASGTKSGKLVEGGALLEAITHVRSTDVVTTPGAGGRVLDVLESMRDMSEVDEFRGFLEGMRTSIMESVQAELQEKWNTKGKHLTAAHKAAISASLKARGGTKKGSAKALKAADAAAKARHPRRPIDARHESPTKNPHTKSYEGSQSFHKKVEGGRGRKYKGPPGAYAAAAKKSEAPVRYRDAYEDYSPEGGLYPAKPLRTKGGPGSKGHEPKGGVKVVQQRTGFRG